MAPRNRQSTLKSLYGKFGRMRLVLALAHHTVIRLAEVGFLLLLFAGIWLAAADLPGFKSARGRTVVAGVALAIGGLLLIIATHWGHFG